MDLHSLLSSETSIDLGLLITALDTVSDGILIVDPNYKIIYKNVSTDYLLSGIGDEFDFVKWRGQFKIYDLKNKKELGITDMPIYRAVNGLKFTDHRVYVTSEAHKDGYYLSCNGTPLIGTNHTIVGGVLTFRDITTDYISERILSQERAFYKNILDLIPALVFVKNDLGEYFFTNQEFDDFWKNVIPELKLEKKVYEEIHRHDEEVKKELKAKEFDEVLCYVDGRTIQFKTIRFPIYNQVLNQVLICGIAFDVTERKQIEKNLAEERLKSVNASKLAAIGTLAGEIGHEINNPMAIIKSITFLLKEMIEEQTLDTSFLKKKIESIDSTLDRVSQIIHSLRNLSRKTLTDAKETCTLRSIFNDVIPLVELKMKRNGIRLICDLTDPTFDVEIFCAHVQLGEVFMNLLSNAADAVDEVEDPWVKVLLQDEGADIIFRIRDNGAGISSDIREKIFEPFFTTKSLGKGTGLGLSISKNIVRAHRGDLSLEPTTKGASFVVRLPKADQPSIT